jgi:protein-S-isoprenylcysteine O-methyltransferase Ste14
MSSATMSRPRDDNPGVIAHPPLILLGALALGFLLERFRPMALPGRDTRLVVGLALVVAALALFAAAYRAFRAAGTNVETNKPSSVVVTKGLYRLSRNPIYVLMAALLAGIGIAAGSAWVIAMVVPFAAIIRYGVVAREERYLEAKFGDEYRLYRARVRRWF